MLPLILAIAVALSWHFSDRVLVPDHSSWLEEVEVEALPPGRIVLARTEDTERPGVSGLGWEGDDDKVVPISISEDFAETLRTAAVAVPRLAQNLRS